MVTEALNRRVVSVPDVVGRSLPKARIVLEDAGLPRIVVLYRESYEDKDTVLDQRPTRGQMVYETSEVTIWVSRGAATSSTCPRSIAAAMRSVATSCATCASCSSTCSTRSTRT